MADARTMPVTVETSGHWTRGMTVGDRRLGERADSPPGRATVCFAPHIERFFAMLIAALRRLDETPPSS
jgi:inosine-uridine nucleoside N-ribohydrolase